MGFEGKKNLFKEKHYKYELLEEYWLIEPSELLLYCENSGPNSQILRTNSWTT